MNNAKPIFMIVILSLIQSNHAAEARLMYHLEDLGSLGDPNHPDYGYQSHGLDINADNRVVGWTYTNHPETKTLIAHAFTTDADNQLIDLGTLENHKPFWVSSAMGLNDAGLIVGYSSVSGSLEHAFLHDGQVMHDLGTLGHTTIGNIAPTSRANGINQQGQIVGSSTPILPESTVFPNLQHAFLTTSNGPMIDLGTLPDIKNPDLGNSYGLAINATGQVTGYADAVQDQEHAFITDADGQNMRDIDNAEAGINRSSRGLAINSQGQVVGYTQTKQYEGNKPIYLQRAFVTDANGANLHPLAPVTDFESSASDINDHGDIIGNSARGAFLIDAEGNFRIIDSRLTADSPECSIVEVSAINDNGAISGSCRHGKDTHAMLLTPQDLPAAENSHGDAIKLTESQKDIVKCDKTQRCKQVTTGSYSLSFKLSADTLSLNAIDLGQLTANSPFSIQLGKYHFGGSLATAKPDKKTAQPPVKLPASWVLSHDECAKPAANASCSRWKTVVDDTVKIGSDKKRALLVTIKGKKSVVDDKDVGRQALAGLCQSSGPGTHQLASNGEIVVDGKRFVLPLKITCNTKQSSKASDSGPVTLNNIAIKASLGDQ